MSSDKALLSTLRRELAQLEAQIRRMREAHVALQEQLAHLQRQHEILTKQLHEQSTAATAFEKKKNLLNLAEAVVSVGHDRRRLQDVLSAYIEKIDFCIKHGGYREEPANKK